eukprot:TRINITY_DN1341_c0_g1_i1.p1 TRINITY_DN1341_c0_g1~~TRINITY_DN1341_c0_g1_i1.p1  ORF type:complete len:140 (-),score=30.47 TRINITY_DN1341_c0_g1_i1:304-723(-)
MATVVPLAAPLTSSDISRDKQFKDTSVDLNHHSQVNHQMSQGVPSENFVQEHSSGKEYQNSFDRKLKLNKNEENSIVGRETLMANSEIPGKPLNSKRQVHWNDSYGNELVEIWEFEPSETADSDEDEDDDSQACTCAIM